MWRRKSFHPGANSNIGQPALIDLTYDETLLQSLPHVKEAIDVKKRMEAEAKQSQGARLPTSSVAPRQPLRPLHPIITNTTSRQDPETARRNEVTLGVVADSNSKRMSHASAVPTVSSVYTEYPDPEQYRLEKAPVPPPLFAGKGRGNLQDAAVGGHPRKSFIPVRKTDELSRALPPSAAPHNLLRYPGASRETADSQPDTDFPSHVPPPAVSDHRNRPVLRPIDLPSPPRDPWRGASGAANLLTPIEDTTPAESVVRSGSVSTASADFQDTPVAMPRKKYDHQESPVSPLSDKEPKPVFQDYAYHGPMNRLSSATKISTVPGSPGNTIDDDDASLHHSTPHKVSLLQKARLPRMKSGGSILGLRQKRSLRQTMSFASTAHTPISDTVSFDDPGLVQSRFSWTTNAESVAPYSPTARDHRTEDNDNTSPSPQFSPLYSQRRDFDFGDETEESKPVPLSRFSWSTQATELPQGFSSPPPPPIPRRYDQRGNRSMDSDTEPFPNFPEDASPPHRNVFAWGSSQLYETPPSKTHAPYQFPDTPDASPPLRNDRYSHELPISQVPRDETPMVHRSRPLPRRDSPGGYIQPAIKRKPAPPSIYTQDISPPASPIHSATYMHKELPLAPPQLESVDYLTMLEAEISTLDLRQKNLESIITKLENPVVTDPLGYDLAARKKDREYVACLKRDLADVKLVKQETGLKLHRAWKRREQDPPTALWIRRTTR